MREPLDRYKTFRDYVFGALKAISRRYPDGNYFTAREVADHLDRSGPRGCKEFIMRRFGLKYPSSIRREAWKDVLFAVGNALDTCEATRSDVLCNIVGDTGVYRFIGNDDWSGGLGAREMDKRDKVMGSLRHLTKTDAMGEEHFRWRYFSPGEVAKQAGIPVRSARDILRKLAVDDPDVEEITFDRVEVVNVGPNGVKEQRKRAYRIVED
jgi:hypothetical protein